MAPKEDVTRTSGRKKKNKKNKSVRSEDAHAAQPAPQSPAPQSPGPDRLQCLLNEIDRLKSRLDTLEYHARCLRRDERDGETVTDAAGQAGSATPSAAASAAPAAGSPNLAPAIVKWDDVDEDALLPGDKVEAESMGHEYKRLATVDGKETNPNPPKSAYSTPRKSSYLAFLNSRDGGYIHFGISDIGAGNFVQGYDTVLPPATSSPTEDQIRLTINNVFKNFDPLPYTASGTRLWDVRFFYKPREPSQKPGEPAVPYRFTVRVDPSPERAVFTESITSFKSWFRDPSGNATMGKEEYQRRLRHARGVIPNRMLKAEIVCLQAAAAADVDIRHRKTQQWSLSKMKELAECCSAFAAPPNPNTRPLQALVLVTAMALRDNAPAHDAHHAVPRFLPGAGKDKGKFQTKAAADEEHIQRMRAPVVPSDD